MLEVVSKNKYYLTEVDKISDSVYCHHDLMGEVFIEAHIHKKGQFLYTEGGVVHVKTATDTFYLPARHFMWIPAGVVHAIYPSSPKVLMRNLYFPVKGGDPTFFSKQGIYPVNNLLLELLLYTKQWNGHIVKKDKNKYAIVNAFKVLLQTTTHSALLLNLPKATDERLKLVIAYMAANIDKEQQIPLLAAKFNMGEKTLYRLFKHDIEMSFINYYTQLRVVKALEYLVTSTKTIAEIATLVGYNSVPTFSNTFSKIMHKRPSEYRKANEIYEE